jgi:hypothetical protein
MKMKSYNFVRYFEGCQTWSLALNEKPSVLVLQNRALARTPAPRRTDVTREEQDSILGASQAVIITCYVLEWPNQGA